ncbi:MAG: hypothetical protein SGI73_21250 [Chloroflexota bacterium]|mgnify:CR=1 FL=1|nr:hypothetical protein [Chloroflexota bacterium]
MIYRLHAEITEDRQLKVDLPDRLPAGEVEIMLISMAHDPEALDEPIAPTWTQEAVRALMTPNIQTGAEIVAWLESETTGWEAVGDGEQWVEEQRKKQEAERRERNRW